MSSPHQKLAESLLKLKELQDRGIIAIKGDDLSRVHKERLVKNGFLREIIKGWYISTPHHEQIGDSTTWFTSYWDFCTRYLQDRYNESYCLSPEQSLLLHAGNQTVPNQLIIKATKGNNTTTNFIFNTSLFVLKGKIPENKALINGLNTYNLQEAIIYSSASVYLKNATDARAALMMVKDASELLGILIEGGHSAIAGRLIGAFRNIGREQVANDISKTMKSVGFNIRETDPFEQETLITLDAWQHSPYANRVKLIWHQMRDVIINVFPKEPGITSQPLEYIRIVEQIYTTDAYHSLSIEKYRVSPDLINKVSSGKWNIKQNQEDQMEKDAMAARGYYQAFKLVKDSLVSIYRGKNAGDVVEVEHRDWYRELFAPSVRAGIIKAADLAGYRNQQVFIAQSQHTPVDKDGLRDMMSTFFELLKNEPNAAVRAVLGHFVFVFIHPYMDGNGRIARFLMNAMLASGGYPWTVIPVEQRDLYMAVLESASVQQNIEPFAKYLAELVRAGLEGKPVAKI